MKKITKIESPKMPDTAKRLRVAAYCRVSTGMEDQLVSLEAQKAHYEELINADPAWEYAGVYCDEGVTGTKKEKRPALQQMLRDCDRHRECMSLPQIDLQFAHPASGHSDTPIV